MRDAAGASYLGAGAAPQVMLPLGYSVGIGADYDQQADSEGVFRSHHGLISSLSFTLTPGRLFPF